MWLAAFNEIVLHSLAKLLIVQRGTGISVIVLAHQMLVQLFPDKDHKSEE